MGDMIVNVVGSFVMCVIIYVSMKKKPDWFKGKVIMTEKQFEKIVMKEDAPSSDPEQDEKSDKRE